MSVEWNRTLLLIDPEDKGRFGFNASDFESRGIRTLTTPYSRINGDPGLAEEIQSAGADALIFTRNDDMPGNPLIGNLLRKLRAGYTTISAIDREDESEQTRQCARDLLDRKAGISIPKVNGYTSINARNAVGTFSLIFDLEQFGGARFGMPRLLHLLESSGIRAVFFITGFIADIYPSLLRRIADGGHEIGLHGSMHEFFQKRPLDEQISRLRAHADELRNYSNIQGVNLIFRMDEASPEAIRQSGLKYFVLFRKHLYYRTRYIPASGRARPFRTSAGDLYFIPIGVETYEKPFYEIDAMIRSARRTASAEGHNHVSILMHPFKDGALQRIETVRKLIKKLMHDLKLRPIKLHEIPEPHHAPAEATKIFYRWDECEADGSPESFPERTRSWWVPPMFHSRRTENIADALEKVGLRTILSAEMLNYDKTISIYPDLLAGGITVDSHDPIRDPARIASEAAKVMETNNSVYLAPRSASSDLWNNLLFQFPRTWDDATMLIRKIKSKLCR
jgi:peptidoglycan/xylan/chitin deacetylase (PgdA/CDA1 family)